MALLALSRRWSLLSFPSFTIYYNNKALANKSHIQSNKVHHPCTFICPFHNYRSASRTYLLCCSQVFMYYFDNAIFLFPIFVCFLYSYNCQGWTTPSQYRDDFSYSDLIFKLYIYIYIYIVLNNKYLQVLVNLTRKNFDT